MVADTHELEALLAPLLVAMPTGLARLVARPHSVVVERAEGSTTEAVAWPPEIHQRVLEVIGAGQRLSSGVIVRRIGDLFVLRQPGKAQLRVDALVHQARLSSLAGRFLNASLGLGRNLLIVGGNLGGEELATALAAEGRRPVVIGDALTAVPPGWSVLDDYAAAAAVGADRAVAWGLERRRLVELFVAGQGIVACTTDRRLDRALMRFELAAEQLGGRGPSPLLVLAGLDLVVVMDQAARVSEIASVELAEDGYRPRLLFATGVPPVRSALVPVGLPSFIGELAAAGHGVLAEELQHAAPAPAGSSVTVADDEPSSPRGHVLVGEPRASERVAGAAPVVEAPAPRFDPALADAPPPGWELDQLGEAAVSEEATPAGVESATLAATFGLGPPPAPPGVAPFAAEGLGAESSGFADALRRARERDAELSASDEGPVDEER